MTIGMVAGFADGDDPPDSFFSMSAGEKAMLGGLTLGVVGGTVGTLTGLVVRSERWERTSVPGRIAVAPAPDGRLAIRYTLTF